MSCVCVLQRWHSGDECDLASKFCKYDLRKGDSFVLSWARVRRMRRGSISSKQLMCGGDVRSILLLPLVARCLETIDEIDSSRCSDCGMDPQDVPHLFDCVAHPNDLSPVNLWDKPIETIRELGFLDPGNLN